MCLVDFLAQCADHFWEGNPLRTFVKSDAGKNEVAETFWVQLIQTGDTDVMGNTDGRLHFDGNSASLEIVNSSQRAIPSCNSAREPCLLGQHIQYRKLAQKARLLLSFQATPARPQAHLPSFEPPNGLLDCGIR